MKYSCKEECQKIINIEITNTKNKFFLEEFVDSMYIILVFPIKKVRLELIKFNIEKAKEMFNNLVN